MTIEFFVPGEPQGKARARTYLPRGSNKFRSVTPDKTRLYEARIRNAFLRAWTKKDLAFPKDRPVRDLDNIIKAVCDALNKYAYHDDAQIVSIECSKAYGIPSGLSVILMDNADHAVRSAQPES